MFASPSRPPPLGEGEIVAGGQGVGVIGAQHPLAVGQIALNTVFAPASRPASPQARGEMVAGGQGVGVIGAQHPLLSARSRSTRCSPRAVGPLRRAGPARLLREARVSG